MKPIVEFKTLKDNSVVPFGGNLNDVTVDVKHVKKYMEGILEITKGAKVEFNETFRQYCKKVLYTYQQINTSDFLQNPVMPEIIECVLLSDNSVAMNINGIIEIKYPENGDVLFENKNDAMTHAKFKSKEFSDSFIDFLISTRKEIKNEINQLIDNQIMFKLENNLMK